MDKSSLDNPQEIVKRLFEASGKMTLLHNMLPRLKEQGHRVLIFSQMTRVLDIIEDYVSLLNWSFCRLDGSTSQYQRQLVIDQFNAPNSPHFIFLLSTRAGGLGINLTSADTIFIYDCDFNPHNDLQAQSRAHRIGQTKPVMVYKLVSAGSVEERILQNATQKLALDHVVVEKMTTGMKASEIEHLLRTGAQTLFAETNVPEGPVRFDEEQMNTLLDRKHLVEEEIRKDRQKVLEESQDTGEEKSQGFFSSFNVAQIWKDEKKDEKKVEEKSAEAPDQYWSELLKDRVAAAQAAIQADLGKGRRSRKQISYTSFPESDKETSDSSFQDNASPSSPSEDSDIDEFVDEEAKQPNMAKVSDYGAHPHMKKITFDKRSKERQAPPTTQKDGRQFQELNVKLPELEQFLEQDRNLNPQLREALLLYVKSPATFALQGPDPLFIQLSKEKDLEIYFRIDPQTREWKVLASVIPPPAPAPVPGKSSPRKPTAHSSSSAARKSRESSAPPPPPGVIPPFAETIQKYERFLAQGPMLPPDPRPAPPVSSQALDAQSIPKDKDLEETFFFFYRGLMPRFQKIFPQMTLSDIFRLIFLRWQTLPMSERIIYFQAMPSTQATQRRQQQQTENGKAEVITLDDDDEPSQPALQTLPEHDQSPEVYVIDAVVPPPALTQTATIPPTITIPSEPTASLTPDPAMLAASQIQPPTADLQQPGPEDPAAPVDPAVLRDELESANSTIAALQAQMQLYKQMLASAPPPQ